MTRILIRSAFHGGPMSITPEALRGQFKISQLGQVFEATLHLCMEEGFPRHQLHYLPSPLIPDDRQQMLVLPDAQVACIFGLTRFSSLNIPTADQAAFTRKPPYESLYLTLPVSELGKANQRRIRFLQEAENLFLDLAERKDRVFVESISHRRLVHGRVVVRHQPVALFNPSGKVIWLHPEALRFGLIDAEFPRSQKCRQLGRPAIHIRNQPEFKALDEEGLPVWYYEARQSLHEAGKDDLMAEALIGLQAQSLLQVSIEQEAEDQLRTVAQEFLTDFETYFGMGGLMPMPGILDPS
jgi:hypothetical protein